MSHEITQAEMAHRLPDADLVDRVEFLVDAARDRRVIHVGFADSRCSEFHTKLDAWVHDQLNDVSASLVGIDLDAVGVQDAVDDGFEAFAADCTKPDEVRSLGIEPAEVVIAGELIEHLDNPGGFLEASHHLVAKGGRLIITTPNAHGLMNSGAAIAGFEVNHPDHVTLYSYVTLKKMLQNHGWIVERAATYVPEVKSTDRMSGRLKALSIGARAVLGAERLLARLGRPFVADGLIVVARSAP